jgi:hypothetical protein
VLELFRARVACRRAGLRAGAVQVCHEDPRYTPARGRVGGKKGGGRPVRRVENLVDITRAFGNTKSSGQSDDGIECVSSEQAYKPALPLPPGTMRRGSTDIPDRLSTREYRALRGLPAPVPWQPKHP